ncbi:class I SAM-dependent methyltransferase [Paenibacillus illinoisensis]|uniref:class I SAM-dependent methyltransferase n=1 Tax=Paenibacillus illinoisensis TaxID=59845 RepID=UPI0034B6403B
MSRVYASKVDIEENRLMEFYKKRVEEKASIDIDAPVVLVGDKDPSKIGTWTKFEVEQRLPLLKIDSDSVVLEIGCGTGRISKYITPTADTYVGCDYVQELIELIDTREDIVRNESTYFIHASFQDITNSTVEIPQHKKFNRFVISGGVLMYINDAEAREALGKISDMFDKRCIIYLSEPIAIQERLTLDRFYSENLESEYSAIYRTEQEYMELFKVFFDIGFKVKISEEFFYDDIKNQKETKQWIFILERN